MPALAEQPRCTAARLPRLGRRGARVVMLLAVAAMLPWAAAQAEDRSPASTGPSNAAPLRPLRPEPVKTAPRWTLSAEVIALARSGTGNRPLVSLVPGDVYWFTQTGTNTSNYPGLEVLNSNQLGQRLAAGPRLSLSYRDPSGYGFELSYFNVVGLTASKAIGPTNPAQWLVMKAPGTFWQTQDFNYQSMVWQDDSRLHSLEANARLELAPRVTLLLGARWLQLRDQLQGTLDPADLGEPTWKYGGAIRLPDAVPLSNSSIVINPPFWTTIATNNLYGVQIGAKATLWEAGPWSLGGTIKAGVFNNRAEHVSLVSMQKQIFQRKPPPTPPPLPAKAAWSPNISSARRSRSSSAMRRSGSMALRSRPARSRWSTPRPAQSARRASIAAPARCSRG
ncbi:MAG: hypothetical protein MZV49_27005 [Rhodopseudomonas palustris]|nr:hypothetical protein [Rhodopseudomonas palustris]